MHAVIRDSGKQYRVSEGDQITVDLRELPEGTETLEFADILLVGDGADVKVGTPVVEGAKVTARLIQVKDPVTQEKTLVHKGPKLIAFKYKRRKGFRKKIGHRSKLLKVRIQSIIAG